MKIVNLNDYNENDGLKNKLRQRMDAHEPELSTSVWDRIHHEMDKKDANRKKRFLWWFSSVAIVVLSSGIITFLILNTNATQPNIVVQNTVEIIFPKMPNTVTKNETTVPKSNTATKNTTTLAAANSTAKETNSNTVTNNPVPTNTVPPPPIVDAPNSVPLPTENGNSTNTTVIEKDKETDNNLHSIKKNKKEKVLPQATPKGKEKTTGNTNTKEVATKDIIAKTDTPKKEVEKGTKTKLNKGLKNRWFVGTMFGYNQTYRTVTDINPSFFYPTAKNRNNYEKRGYGHSYGIELGFYPVKKLFIKSGIGIFSTSENVAYDIKLRENQTIAVRPPNYEDSVAVGTTIQKQNTYQYIQIPLEIGYSRDITKKWGLFASGGVALNLLQKYEYYLYETFYGTEMTAPNAQGNYTDMYKNYIMLSGSIGGQYKITDRWVATLGINYRRAVTSAANKKYEVDIKPYSIGATTGLAFRF